MILHTIKTNFSATLNQCLFLLTILSFTVAPRVFAQDSLPIESSEPAVAEGQSYRFNVNQADASSYNYYSTVLVDGVSRSTDSEATYGLDVDVVMEHTAGNLAGYTTYRFCLL